MSVFFDRQYLSTLAPLIKHAQREILVAVYEWAWYDHQQAGTAQEINRLVCYAAAHGVKIQALLHNDAGKTHLSKINHKTASRLRRCHVEVRLGNSRRIIHAKLWVFDGHTAIVCTHNISTRAVTTNAELGVVLTDPADVQAVRNYFLDLFSRYAPPKPADEVPHGMG